MPAKSVLIADDDADLLSALTLRCELSGIETRRATDAMKALRMLHLDPPNLLIIDVNMPGGSGLNVCELLRTDARMIPVPAIVLTGRADRETIERCQDAGVRYVRKGVDMWARIKPLLRELLSMEIR